MIDKNNKILCNAQWNTRFRDNQEGIKISKISDFLDVEKILSIESIEKLTDIANLSVVQMGIAENMDFYFSFNQLNEIDFKIDFATKFHNRIKGEI